MSWGVASVKNEVDRDKNKKGVMLRVQLMLRVYSRKREGLGGGRGALCGTISMDEHSSC